MNAASNLTSECCLFQLCWSLFTSTFHHLVKTRNRAVSRNFWLLLMREAVKILMENKSQRCTKTPLKVRRNMSFLVDVSSYQSWEDIKSDMNGAYTRPLRIGTWTIDVYPDEASVEILEKKKVALNKENEFHVHINSKMNAFGLCRSIFFLTGESGEILHHTVLLQYHIVNENCEEVKFEVSSHGNRKHRKKAFYPTQEYNGGP